MNIKYYNSIYNFLFNFIIASFIFFWGVKFFDFDTRLIILILLIPIIFSLLKNITQKKFVFNLIKNNKNFIYFFSFFLIHLTLMSLINNIEIQFYNLKSIIFFTLVGIIYIFNRDRIINNLNKIIFIFLAIFIFVFFISFFMQSDDLVGFCSQQYVIYISQKTGLNFYPGNNLLFQENSHLAMVLIGSLFYILHKGFQNFYYLLFFIISFVVSIFYLSTTYLAGLILSGFVLSFYFFYKKSLNYKKLIMVIIGIVSIAFFLMFTDKNCAKKITDIRFKSLHKKDFFKEPKFEPPAARKFFLDLNTNLYIEAEIIDGGKTGYYPKNLTSTTYERSIKINIETIKNNLLGWGYSNNNIATTIYQNDNSDISRISQLRFLNMQDALGNLFKLINEFGILIIFLFYKFLFYFFNKEKTQDHKIFFICIFLVQLFRGAGYVNGGFCFAIIEIIFYQKFLKK
tara:strand:+ start:5109 stop:6476 length:1368 start_codon:yes stop_codon:yes gene_type:complete